MTRDEVLKFFRFSECAGSYQVQMLVGVMLLLGATNIVLDKALDKAVVLRITKEIGLCILGCFVMRYGLFVRMDKINSTQGKVSVSRSFFFAYVSSSTRRAFLPRKDIL